MSDIFNKASNKTKLLSALKVSEHAGNVETILYPPDFEHPEDIKNSKELVHLAGELGLEMNKTRLMPKSKQVATKNYVTKNCATLVGLPDEDGHVRIKTLSDLPMDGTSGYVPQYRPKHNSLTYDKKVLKQIIFQSVTSMNPDWGNLIRDAIEVAKTKVMSSGTYKGQLHRLAKVTYVNHGKNEWVKAKPFKDCIDERLVGYGMSMTEPNHNYYGKDTLTTEIIAQIFERYLPVNISEFYTDEHGKPFPGLNFLPSYYTKAVFDEDGDLDVEKSFDFLPGIGKEKSAGMPWIGKKKKDHQGGALIIGDSLLRSVSNSILGRTKETLNTDIIKPKDDDKQSVFAFLRENWYLGCSLLFPKQERYDRSDITKKTRNICAAPFTNFIMGALICEPGLKYTFNALNGDTPSLYKMNPFSGGLDNLVQKLGDAVIKGTHLSFVYADNWYIFYRESDGKYSWFSYDLVTGEAQTTRDDVKALMYYFLTRVHVTREGKPNFSMSWAYYALNILPNLTADSMALLMNVLFTIPGLTSGSFVTFLCNHLKTSSIDFIWKENECPRPESERFKSFLGDKKGGLSVNVKLELEVSDFWGKLQDLKTNTPKQGLMQDDMEEPLDLKPQIVEADLLGWNIGYSNYLKQYLPVLNYDRLLGAIICKQRDDSTWKEPGDREIHTLSWAYSCNLVGGWAYKPIKDALDVQINDAYNNLIKNAAQRIGPRVGDAVASTDFGDILKNEMAKLKPVFAQMDASKRTMKEALIALHERPEDSIDKDKIVALANSYGNMVVSPADIRGRMYYKMERTNGARGTVEWVKSFSVASTLTLQDWWLNKGFLNGTNKMTSLQEAELRASQSFQSGVDEMNFLKGLITSEVVSIKKKREKDPEKISNPRVGYKLHPEGYLKQANKATSSGPTGLSTIVENEGADTANPKTKYKTKSIQNADIVAKLRDKITNLHKLPLDLLQATLRIIQTKNDSLEKDELREDLDQLSDVITESLNRRLTDPYNDSLITTLKTAIRKGLLKSVSIDQITALNKQLKEKATDPGSALIPISLTGAPEEVLDFYNDNLEAAITKRKQPKLHSTARPSAPQVKFYPLNTIATWNLPDISKYVEKLEESELPWVVNMRQGVKGILELKEVYEEFKKKDIVENEEGSMYARMEGILSLINKMDGINNIMIKLYSTPKKPMDMRVKASNFLRSQD